MLIAHAQYWYTVENYGKPLTLVVPVGVLAVALAYLSVNAGAVPPLGVCL